MSLELEAYAAELRSLECVEWAQCHRILDSAAMTAADVPGVGQGRCGVPGVSAVLSGCPRG